MNENLKKISSVTDLLELWKTQHFKEGKIRFIYDGCADYDMYNSCQTKIMILLKEGYFDERDRLLPGRKDKPWVKYFVSEGNNWAYRFDENIKFEKPWMLWCKVQNLMIPILAKLGIDKDEALMRVAIVNLKKSKDDNGEVNSKEPNNKNPFSNNERVLDYAINDRDYLIRQIELLDPDIIICGGTFEMANKANLIGKKLDIVYKYDSIRGLRAIYDYEMECKSGIKNIKVVDMCHPSYSMSHLSVGEAIANRL